MGKNIDIIFGHYELEISRIYQMLYQINDIIIGIIFLIGSFFFFSDTLTYYGTWLFVAGSLLMLVRPFIALTHHIHVSRVYKQKGRYSQEK